MKKIEIKDKLTISKTTQVPYFGEYQLMSFKVEIQIQAYLVNLQDNLFRTINQLVKISK